MVFPLRHNLQVQHDPGLRLMRFQWVGSSISTAMRPGLVYGRDLIVAHQPTHALVDLTGLPLIEMQDELWMSIHWFPKIAGTELRCAALIMRPGQLHNQMAIEAMLWLGRHLTRFQIQVFEAVPAALDWLTSGDAAAGRYLQADWDAALPTPPLSI